MDIHELLSYSVNHKASDLHLSSGCIPLIRVDGLLHPVPLSTELDEVTISRMVKEILPEDFATKVLAELDSDFSIDIPKVARFRVNVFRQFRGNSVAFRCIPMRVPTIEELQLSDIFYRLCELRNGLILVTGPTGAGKTTTLAAMIDYINRSKQSHIVTIEDPIEYVHDSDKKCLIQQREVKRHTESFGSALRAALREDPNYIFVGEMRDLETIRLALTAAETGHLVLATLHTNSAASAVDRIIDVFPSSEKPLIRSILSNSLRAVIAQVLVKRISGGRIAAQEIMLCNAAIRNMIRDDKVHQIDSVIQTSQQYGMCTLEQSLKNLALQNSIDPNSYLHIMSDQI